MKEKDIKLHFVKTCEFCPEQYDVFYNDKCIAYVRLRFGHLSVNPVIDDEIDFYNFLYSKVFKDKWKGNFKNWFERYRYMRKIKKAIKEYLIKKRNLN